MESKPLPPRPNLEHYKKQAKDLLKQCRSQDAEALQRVRKYQRDQRSQGSFTLADAQFAIAREHGFESWPKFAKQIQVLSGKQSSATIWKEAQRALIDGDAVALDSLLQEHPQLFREQSPPGYGSGGLRPDYSGSDARTIIAANHHFENWSAFEAFSLARRTSPVAEFEAAVDAIVTGDAIKLETLLRAHPELVFARSLRRHRSTLLHYVGANGVEGFRQRSPRNIVHIAEMLIRAGSDVNAVADMYGGSKTLGLVATSIHPYLAGVLEPLIALLLEHGATVDSSSVNDCLANGRKRGAEIMASYGASLDLEGAAGIGRLDLVKDYFEADGSLRPNATQAQMRNGFAWACQYGRTNVVEYLLDQGMPINAPVRNHDQTGLHWAALNAHTDIVKLLLQRQAPVDARDGTWGNTPLGWALHGWGERAAGDPGTNYYETVDLLINAGASVKPDWLADPAIQADPKLLTALQRGRQ